MTEQTIDSAELDLIQDEAVRITCELIRIDSTNYGDGTGPCEQEAAEYVMEVLREVGLEPQYVESAPRRASVVVRVPGADRDRPGLVLHGHLDVVPADADDWSVPPFSGEIRDGMIHGRGAVDMKDMVAMLLANLRSLARTGAVPPRDIVFGFFADEEAGGAYGAEWLVKNHPEVFAGCSEAISEVGGYSITLTPAGGGPARRTYLLQTAEKGYAWMRIRARGRAGHGSVPNDENAIVRLAQAICRIDAHDWGTELIPPVITLLDHVSEVTGIGWDPDDPAAFLPQLGGARQFVAGTLANSANVTTLLAGRKSNVVPGSAEASIDCRFLPGSEDVVLDTLRALCGEHVELVVDRMNLPLDVPAEGPLIDVLAAAIDAEDPGAQVVPYCLSAGTDNKELRPLGIAGYGFAPLRLPADLDFAPLFHGVDERVPVDAVRFGARVLRRVIATC
ncbi:M20/M25/M40 family metallo-hydrolase [Propionicicella superfundia]|uniref:M20/M25/M40 family metallo-hydrolase n=1 Tax=Propionicicella superfundia TaxID=348582 RepID=UPI00040ACB93|nr:M20/M25/M40 family metallo-hydrolase [Propionicicella superfundia]